MFTSIMLAFLMLFSKPPGGPDFQQMRSRMVERQIMARGVKNSRVIDAMIKVPRHLFVPVDKKFRAYDDMPLPIGEGQTISQPYIVALMTELLEPQKGERVLEIGTGSGYQAAVLAEIVDTVYSIEIICALQQRADSLLKSLRYNNIVTKCGDGYDGWPDAAPFDGIIVTAAPGKVPQPLLTQLKEGGVLVIPVGENIQHLEVYKKTGGKLNRKLNIPVRFVPMTGKVEDDEN